MQTEQRYLSDQEKAETDMSASAGSSMFPNGGPDGGDGGRGGDVIFEVDEGLNTLQDFRHRKKILLQKTENRAARDAAMEKMAKISF